MVGIVRGNELGLDTTSLAKLGSLGSIGMANHGRGGEAIYVNAASGNLIVQQRDEIRVGLGPDAELLRTYNSQGQLSDDPDAPDNWLPGWSKQVFNLVGTVNTSGSSLWRRDAQGARANYAYSGTFNCYVSTLGEGAQDFLIFDAAGNTWTWTEGSSRVREVYGFSNGVWRIVSRQDRYGNAVAYSYDSDGRLTALSSPAGERLVLEHNQGRLTQVRSEGAGGSLQTRVRYDYDSQGRLVTVTVDLSPEDNSVADGKVYLTRYGYDGQSTRISTLTQSDGTTLAFSYTLGGDGAHRLSQIIEDPDGLRRITALSYDLAARSTTITEPGGGRIQISYDSAGRLLSLKGQSVDGINRQVTYQWGQREKSDYVVAMTDALGRVTTYAYNERGNRILQRDALGNTVTRLYNDSNQLLSETRYRVPDPDGAGDLLPSAPQTQRYVYSEAKSTQLLYQLGGEGEVTEYRYDAKGQVIRRIVYLDARFDLSTIKPGYPPVESTLSSWVAARDRARVQLTEYAYDLRGQLERETRYGKVGSSGTGVFDGSESVTRFVYGPRGELLHRIDARAARPSALWSQDFSIDSTGLSTLPSSYALVQFGRLDTWSKYISGKDSSFNISGTRTQSVGTVFRGELTTGGASPTRYLRYGADNASSGGTLRRHMVLFSADGIFATYQSFLIQE